MREVQRLKVLQGGSTLLMVNTMTMKGLPCVFVSPLALACMIRRISMRL
jgi:hypothetical protein|eukprot:COSAG01_NODE_2100_length_8429_cov_29.066507_9_plen_49_part_00